MELGAPKARTIAPVVIGRAKRFEASSGNHRATAATPVTELREIARLQRQLGRAQLKRPPCQRTTLPRAHPQRSDTSSSALRAPPPPAHVPATRFSKAHPPSLKHACQTLDLLARVTVES